MSALKFVLIITLVAVFSDEAAAAVPERGPLSNENADVEHPKGPVAPAVSLKPTTKSEGQPMDRRFSRAFNLEPNAACGGFTAAQCCSLCGQMGFPYCYCGPSECICHFG